MRISRLVCGALLCVGLSRTVEGSEMATAPGSPSVAASAGQAAPVKTAAKAAEKKKPRKKRKPAPEPEFEAAPLHEGPVQAGVPDANRNGRPDVADVLDRIADLEQVGVVFDENDPGGHVPMRRSDGKYHMVCVDLLTVAYRAAGIKVPSTRLVTSLMGHVRSNPRFHWYQGPGINLWKNPWRPQSPFRVGDMLFVHYSDNADRHSGIVTGVDPATGLPSHITQVSVYSDNEGIHRSTYQGFFSLSCRQLTGWARPASWETAPPSAEELALTVTPPLPTPKPVPAGVQPGGGVSSEEMHQALHRVRSARVTSSRSESGPPAADPPARGFEEAHGPHPYDDGNDEVREVHPAHAAPTPVTRQPYSASRPVVVQE